MSQVVSSADLLNHVREYGQVLHAAHSPEVSAWTFEHVSNAFGWADVVEHYISHIDAEDEVVQSLERDIEVLQEQGSTATIPNQPQLPRRSEIPLSMAQLRGARSLLLRVLLANTAVSDATAKALLSRALGWDEGSVTAHQATKALLPGVLLHSELKLLSLMRERAIEWQNGAGAVDGSDEAKVRLDAALAGQDAAACAETAASALAIAYVLDARVTGLLMPPSLAEHAQIMWSRAELSSPSAPLSHLVATLHAKLSATEDGEAACAVWSLPAEVVAIVCSAEAVVEAADMQPTAQKAKACSTPLLDAYSNHLHKAMRALHDDDTTIDGANAKLSGADGNAGGGRGSAGDSAGDSADGGADGGADGDVDVGDEYDTPLPGPAERQWRAWRSRWDALISQPDPTGARAKAKLAGELARWTDDGQRRLRYLAELLDSTQPTVRW